MQTLYVLLNDMHKQVKRSIARALVLLICVLISPLLTACGTLQNIHVEHTVHTAAPENACAKAYRLAQKRQREIKKNQNNTSLKDFETAAKYWKTVAQQCPGRLSESIVYSTQAQWEMLSKKNSDENSNNVSNKSGNESSENTKTTTAQQMEHDSYANLIEVINHYKNFKWTHQPLAQAAEAEDKLAFILQTLAARKEQNIALEYSDMASTNAQTLMRAAGEGTDLRKKVYDIPQETLESGKTHDSVNGKDLPITAIAYMDCAREELAAFNQIITITSKNNNASENNVTAKSDDNDSVMRAQQTLKNAIVQLITSRLLRAYELGYPTDAKLILK
ncbi:MULTISPECIES: hypothetical protein [Gardnerella]|uniref:Uncharacterized protein n=2 Tax=Gardnerella TaxID=2701 RepID=A0AAP8IRW7_GARVA|nr:MULTISPECIES: hypothetical protein [Gardnerella]EFH27884.1 hypothetical protein GVAMD_0951 [Gardnerella vaginalis AMD]EIK79092.1 hypothetical protein CGSMWGv6420B_01976 [Gardnerella vaginalis 6420B]NSX31482.1 hypothetical protein [Gardnerella vaginalis]RFT32053.1 hypothetical protein CG404_00670 [Bifidobacteriaceae bacterium VN003]RFT33141.1 hypothetical protein CG401_04985 [Bifidobacteriaceae bacterium NR019]RFT35200.1 hypothetical protein CG400_03695 [Bifidobacteriaceae bacterium NR017]